MRTLTGKLPEQYKEPVRFVCVGMLGTGIQYGLYYLLLQVFDAVWPEMFALASIAFTISYCIELVINYLLTSYYTFRTKATWHNLLHFALARVFNYALQIGGLQLFMLLTSEETAGILTIMLAGIINFFVMRFVFHSKD